MRILYGDQLRAVRHEIGISAMHVAYRAGLNVTYLYRLEGGEHRVTNQTAENLASALGTNPERFSTVHEVERADAVNLAERLGVSRIRVYQYLYEGRVSGAYKDDDGWHIPEGAEILPPGTPRALKV